MRRDRRQFRRDRFFDRRYARSRPFYDYRWRKGYRWRGPIVRIYDYDYYSLGPPPRGYYYGRVGRDILLFAVATNAIANFIFAIDAINDDRYYYD